MSEKDLEQTKPIKTLNDLTDSRLDRYETQDSEETRSEKYGDVLIEEELKEQEEKVEEALAEKNILEAEKIIESEKNKKEKKKKIEEDDEDDEITEDDGLLGKLIVKWRGLPKKKKNLIIVGVIFGLIVLIALIVFLIMILTGDKEKQEVKPEEQAPEVVPVVVDNFYYKEGKLYFIKDDETELGNYECQNQDDKLCYVKTNNNRDSFDVTRLQDKTGTLKIQRLPIYEDNYVFLFDNKDENSNEIILYSIKEKKEIAKYLEVKAYGDNLVIVKDLEEKYGLIQIQNGITEVIKPQYLYLGMIDGETNLIAKSKKGYAVISKKNKVLSSYFDSKLTIKNYNSNFVVTLTGEDYSVYDYKANLIESGHEFITLVDKYVVLVDGKKLYVRDASNNKYNENGIKLSSTNYVKTFVYDENDQLVETKKSFELNIKNNKLEVAVFSSKDGEATYTQLSILEALANAKYNYVNYFNGKLFFYSDEKKQELIGYYTCANENILTSSDDKYTSCFIARDTIREDNDMVSPGELTRKSLTPIINGKYVFIADGSTSINLYNLEDKSTEVTYLEVNSMSAHNDNQVLHYDGKLETIVKTKSGKYGVISFEGKDVGKLHAFEYNSLERLGDYYLALDTSNSWRILYYGSESAGFPNKVRGYNSTKSFFKVMENGKYYVYNNLAEKVVADGYHYVSLYTNFYATVNDDKEINIYDYSGNKLNNLTVKVGDYKYYGVDNPAFKVKNDGEKYIISLWDGTKYNDNDVSTLPTTPSGDEEQQESETQTS